MALTKITGEGLGTSINSTNTSGNSTLGLISGTSNSSVINLGDTDASNVGQVKYHHGVNSMVLRTNSTDKVTLDSTGNMLFNQSGTGIYLGTTSATASNLLDDYEEGTWTPTVSTATGYSNQTGHYTKIGRLVQLMFNIQLTGTSSASNFLQGLPFSTASTGQSNGAVSVGYYSNLATNMIWISGYIPDNNNIVYFSGNSANSGTIQHNGANVFSGTTRILGTIIYMTS